MNAPDAVLQIAGLAPCLIVNPKSFRASRGDLAARAVALATAYGAEVIQAHRPVSIIAALDRVLKLGSRRMIVLSGDGTMQAMIDHLAGLPPGSPMPQLLLLGGGRSNLIPADFGGRGKLLNKLESALRRCRDGATFKVEERFTLSIEQSPAPPRRGFFMAAGVIDDAVRACRQHRNSGSGWLRKGHLSTAWYLLKQAILALAGRSPLSCSTLDIDAPSCGRLQGPSRVLIASTLLHREGWFNPYADRGVGPLRVTAVARSAPGFWRSLPRILLGRFTRRLNLERGYLSGRCDQVTVLGMTGYSLDGEAFDTDPTRPVVIRTGPRMSFLRS
ncbi:MAG: diacylglycerol kinase family protein [Panacagrimonas sp.]